MVHLPLGRTMAIDDVAYLEGFQQRIQHGQRPHLVMLLVTGQPIDQLGDGEGPLHGQPGPLRRPFGAPISLLPGAIAA